MIPQVGQQVKCILRTGAMVEGIVEEWGETVQMLSLDGESILIIPRPSEDIMLIKILLISEEEIPKESFKDPELVVAISNNVPYPNSLEEEFDEVYNQPSGDDLRTKKMAELKILLAEQDKKIVSEKIKDHHIGNTRKVEYGFPQLNKIKSPQ
jgi:hypothetical protein